MMELISMTATFGKLEHETIRFTPGLNVIQAPNEWGKSTWCAFLMAMLYGLDTKQRSVRGALAAKERYKPWSGLPMEGTLELLWDGRPVTIQRRSKGRTPLGVFRAFDTETGTDIPELTAETCGVKLLGVEESVFRRSGFVRLQDLPVTQDEATMRRLNALVSTGTDGTQAELLAGKLRELKNKCQYNRTGAIPQTQAALDQIRQKLQEQELLLQRQTQLEEALAREEQTIALLRQQQAHWAYEAAREKLARLEEARLAAREAEAEAQAAQARCRELPGWESALQEQARLRKLQESVHTLELEQSMLPPPPEAPQLPPALEDTPPEEMEATAAEAMARLGQKPRMRNPLWLYLPAGAAGVGAAIGLFLSWPRWISPALGLGALLLLAVGLWLSGQDKKALLRWSRQQQELLSAFGAGQIRELPGIAARAAESAEQYAASLAHSRSLQESLRQRRQALVEEIAQLTSGAGIPARMRRVQQTIELWDANADAQRELVQVRTHLKAVESLAGELSREPVDAVLPYDREETDARLSRSTARQLELRAQLQENRGRIQSAQPAPVLRQQAAELEERLSTLRDHYQAAVLGLAALEQAQEELRRRFAPQLTQAAREILSRLTQGRYEKLLLEQDMTLSTSAAGEDTLRSVQWRSDGTIDQLYLALRLAICRVLLHQGAPLVLDDALVRFDHQRLAQAMEVLRQEAEHRQILLFTCTGREKSFDKKVPQL